MTAREALEHESELDRKNDLSREVDVYGVHENVDLRMVALVRTCRIGAGDERRGGARGGCVVGRAGRGRRQRRG